MDGDTFTYGPDGPTERELRLLGDVSGKRLLELGCGTGAVSIALAQQGAVVIGVDTDHDRLRRPAAATTPPTSASTGTTATSPTSPSSAPTPSTRS